MSKQFLFIAFILLSFQNIGLSQNVILNSQAEVDAFDSSITDLNGRLIIGSSGSDITDLSNLSNLRSISGRIIIQNNLMLRDLKGLENLNFIGNSITINDNGLNNIDALDNVEFINGDFFLTNEPNITDINLPLLNSIRGVLDVDNCLNLENLLLNSATFIGGIELKDNQKLKSINLLQVDSIIFRIQIDNNSSLTEVLLPNAVSNLTNFHLRNNEKLESVTVPLIQNVSNDLLITSNPLLSNLDLGGLQSVGNNMDYDIPLISSMKIDKLTSVGGFLRFELQNLNSLQLDQLKTIDEFFFITKCDELVEINAPTLETISGRLTINQVENMEILDMPNLVKVGDNLTLNCENLEIFSLNSLDTVNGFFSIIMPKLHTLSLDSLQFVDGSLGISVSQLLKLELPLLEIMNGLLSIGENQSLTEITFRSLNQVAGISIFSNSSLESIDGFDSLEEVRGTIRLYDNTKLKTITLNNVDSVYQNIAITEEQIETIDFSNLNYVGGDIHIENTNELNFPELISTGSFELENYKGSVLEFPKLETIRGDFEIDQANELATINLSNLIEMEGYLTFLRIAKLVDIKASNLTKVKGLNLVDVDILKVLSLPLLTDIDEYVNLKDNPLLKNLDFGILPQTMTYIWIDHCNSITNVDVFESVETLTSFLIITNNKNLENLYGFANINLIWHELVIKDNESLGDCCGIQNLLLPPSGVGIWSPGTIEISSNIRNCINEETIKVADCESNPIARGTLFVDVNEEGCSGPTVFPFVKLKVETENAAYVFFLDSKGEYEIPILVNSDYKVTPILDENFTSSPESLILSLPEDSLNLINNFCLQPRNEFTDIKINIIPSSIARPGFDVTYKIIYQNVGTFSTSGFVRFYYDDKYTSLLETRPAFSIEDDDFLEWSYINLSPFEKREIFVDLNLNSPQNEFPLTDLASLISKAEVFPMVDDFTIKNNTSVIAQSIRNSFDPNDKTCLQGEFILDENLEEPLGYLIRFENIGTASAVNVEVVDQIDTGIFDITSLRVIDASHSMFTTIEDDIVRFNFEDIYLPFEDEFNDGYVLFEIKLNEGAKVNDRVSNTANIYFDFNDPIQTNTYTSIIVTDMDGDGFHNLEDCNDNNLSIYPGAQEIDNNGIDEDCDGLDFVTSSQNIIQENIEIHPNPTSKVIYINIPSNFRFRVQLFNSRGSEIFSEDNVSEIFLDENNSGVYLVKITDLTSMNSFVQKVLVINSHQ